MKTELGSSIPSEKAINACFKEAERWEQLAKRMGPQNESFMICRKAADMWIEEAARIETESLLELELTE